MRPALGTPTSGPSAVTPRGLLSMLALAVTLLSAPRATPQGLPEPCIRPLDQWGYGRQPRPWEVVSET